MGITPTDARGAHFHGCFGLKKCIGGKPVGLRVVAVGLDPGDFGLELGDTLIEFVARVAVEALGLECAGGIAARSRAVVFIHLC